MTAMAHLPEVVSHEEWLRARKELLAEEKDVTRARDRVNAARRRLPMVRVEKPYVFEGPHGEVGLLELFEGRAQLVVHHFMWTFDLDADGTEHPRDTGCPSCSSAADQIGNLRQLHVRNTSPAAVTRAPYAKLAAYRERMGWSFPWYSSAGGDFNYDFHATVDERVAPVQIFHRSEAELADAGTPWSPSMRGDWPGISAFLRSATRSSTPTPPSAGASRSSTTAIPTSTSPPSAARRHGRSRRAARPLLGSRSAVRRCGFPTSTAELTSTAEHR